MGKKIVKIQLYDKSKTKSEILTALGTILDDVCTFAQTEENLFSGEYYLDAEFIYDKKCSQLEEEAILKVTMDYGDELFSIAKVTRNLDRIIVLARQVTMTESLGLWLEDVRAENKDGQSAITHLLNGALGTKNITLSSNITTTNTAYYQNVNLYNALHSIEQSFQNRWGGEIQRRLYNVKLDKKIGQNRGVVIRSKKNLIGFESETNIDSVITRIKPVGFNGITIDGFVNSDYIDNYKYVKTEKIEYSDVKVKENETDEEGFDTLEDAQAELIRLANLEYTENKVDVLTAEYNINFVDLSQTEEYKNYIQAEKVYLGDEIQVIEDKCNIDITVRAIIKRFDILSQKTVEITLSNKDTYQKAQSINQIKRELEEKIDNNKSYYDNALKNMNDLITSGLKNSYVIVKQNEILVMDSTDINSAVNVWRWNKNGLAFSSTGYFGTYDTAITMEGEIIARFLTGLIVKGDEIDARNLNVYDDDGNKTLSISSSGLFELVQGLIRIDDKGVRINLVDSEDVILGYVVYDGQGVNIFDANDNAISNFAREGSFIEKLVVDDINCKQVFKIANLSGCPLDWYIAPTATGDGTGRDENNKATSLKDVLRRIRSYGLKTTDAMTIHIEDNVVLNEDIIFQDFSGAMVTFLFGKNVVINTELFVIEDVTNRVKFLYDTDVRICDDETTQEEASIFPIIRTNSSDYMYVANANYVEINGIRFKGSGQGVAIKGVGHANVLIDNCDISDFDYAVDSRGLSNVTLQYCRGSVKQLAYVYSGAIFATSIRVPKCSESELVEQTESGIWIKQEYYNQLDTLYQESSTSQESTNTNESFKATNLYTKVEGSGISTTSRIGYCGQGRYKNYKSHRGFIILSKDIKSTLENKESYILKLRMTRLSTAHGYNSKTPHPILRAKKIDGTYTSYFDSNTTFARGETLTITLNEEITQAIAEGATQLELWAENNQQQQYSYYNNVELLIEGQNKTSTNDNPSGGSGTGGISSTFADEFYTVAKSYWDNCTNESGSSQSWANGTVYRASNTPLSGTCNSGYTASGSFWVNCNGTYFKAIDCSTLVGMALRGWSYSEGAYGSLEQFNRLRANKKLCNSTYDWAIAPVLSDGTIARTAADLGQYFYDNGLTVNLNSIGSSSDNFSGLQKGDILFYARKNADGSYKQPERFMKISHVAIVGDISSTTGKRNLVECTTPTTKKHTVNGVSYNAGLYIGAIEGKQPNTIVLVARMGV